MQQVHGEDCGFSLGLSRVHSGSTQWKPEDRGAESDDGGS